MKINPLFTAFLLLSFSCQLSAKTIELFYDGKPVSENVQLTKDDIVMINTTVKVGTKVMITVSTLGEVETDGFTFTSSMENVDPDRVGPFTDQMYAGADPGWISYTYTGINHVNARFELSP